MLKKIFISVCLLSTMVLSGCVHIQKPIKLDSGYLKTDNKIGLLIVDLPEGSFIPSGQIGLLDYAIISSSNDELEKHLKQVKASDFNRARSQFLKILKKRGMDVVEIKQNVDFTKLPENGEKEGFAVKNFSELKNKYNINDLLVLRLVNFGVIRKYYGFLPTSNPNSFAAIEGQLVDLKTHQLKWYYNERLENAIAEPWDEPSLKFPNVSESVYKAIEQAAFALKQNFSGAGS